MLQIRRGSTQDLLCYDGARYLLPCYWEIRRQSAQDFLRYGGACYHLPCYWELLNCSQDHSTQNGNIHTG